MKMEKNTSSSCSYAFPHKVFKNNPLKMKKLINKVVRVSYNNSKSIEGTVYTIDPVSQMIALLVKNETTQKIDLHMIFGSHFESLKLIGQTDLKISDDLFSNENYEVELTEQDKECSRKKVVTWLKANMIPIDEDGDLLKLKDVLTIHPPYGANNCFSQNEIILEKIQNLILTMEKECNLE